jgi:mRNA interferase MazF
MTPSETGYEQGDVILVRFVYADETGAKRRPAVILSTDSYQQGRQEAIIAAITSNVQHLLVGDHRVEGWQQAGLLFPSVATGIIRTVKQTMIERRLGEIVRIQRRHLDVLDVREERAHPLDDLAVDHGPARLGAAHRPGVLAGRREHRPRPEDPRH